MRETLIDIVWIKIHPRNDGHGYVAHLHVHAKSPGVEWKKAR